MSSYLLIGAKGCGSAIAEGFLKWGGIPFQAQNLNWDEHQKWPSQIGDKNPLGQVPTLVLPSGEVLTESLAIAVHVNRLKPGLIPESELADAFWRWSVYIVANIYPTFTFRDNIQQFTASEDVQKSVGDKILMRRKELWKILEKKCQAPFFLGETFSAIDVYLAVMSQWTPGKSWFVADCPKINAVADLMANRPLFDQLLKSHFS